MRRLAQIAFVLLTVPFVLSGGHTRAADPKIITRAADPKIITLSCDGTLTDTTHQPKPIEKVGVVANLNERTVSFMGWVAPINNVDAAGINFNGKPVGGPEGDTQRIDGYLDRVTGHMIADTTTSSLNSPIRDHYDVLCKVTNRVF
jgi:hypothetical protein